MRSLIACLLLTTACAVPDSEVVDLADFPISRFTINVSASHIRVDVEYGYPYNTCPLFGEVTAVIGGEVMTLDTGGFRGRTDGYPDCSWPVATIDHNPSVSPATFELSDASATIACPLDAGLVKREATLVPDGPWQASAGQTLTVRWPSAAELATDQVAVYFGDLRANVLSHEGDLLTFRVPVGLAAGTYALAIRRDTVERSIDCGGTLARLSEAFELKQFAVDLVVM